MSVALSKMQDETVIERFKTFYRTLSRNSLNDIDTVYAPHILFKDPIHEIRGINSLHTYLDDLCANLESCRFEYLDEIARADSCYIKWDMHFRHPKVSPSIISVRGMSQLKISNNYIVYHEDVYDLGAMLYEHLPLLGSATKWLKNRLATDSQKGNK